MYIIGLLLTYMQVSVFLNFNVSLHLQFRYTLCHPTRIGLRLWGLLLATNATIGHQTVDYQVEGFEQMESRGIECTPWNIK